MEHPPLPGVGRDVLPGGPPPELTTQRESIVLFACGDPAHAEHESIAIAACTTLPAELLERVDVKLVGPMRPEYLRDLAPGTQVIVADTHVIVADTHEIVADTVSGTPGDICVLPLIEMNGRETPLQASSTVDPPLDDVVAMAQLLRDQPLQGRFVGIGVESVDLRALPDPGAVETLRDAVIRVIAELDGT